jgi:hypothetical protein
MSPGMWPEFDSFNILSSSSTSFVGPFRHPASLIRRDTAAAAANRWRYTCVKGVVGTPGQTTPAKDGCGASRVSWKCRQLDDRKFSEDNIGFAGVIWKCRQLDDRKFTEDNLGFDEVLWKCRQLDDGTSTEDILGFAGVFWKCRQLDDGTSTEDNLGFNGVFWKCRQLDDGTSTEDKWTGYYRFLISPYSLWK